MRKILLGVALGLVIVLGGCSTATIKKGDCVATYTTVLKNISEIKINACGAKGSATSSDTDPAASQLVEILKKASVAP